MNARLEGDTANSAASQADRLSSLSPAERTQVLDTFNATSCPFPSERLIHELIEEQAAKSPDAVALAFESRLLSYKELNTRANRLAHYLSDLGVRPDRRVAICFDRGFEMIVGIIAILKAGGAFVPLDPRYPMDRLAFILEDSSPDLVLLHEDLTGNLPEFLITKVVFDIDREAQEVAIQSSENPIPATLGLCARNLAYVIYTSGSTGKPKGVMIEHRGLVNFSCFLQHEFEAKPQSSVLQFASPSFDASVQEWILALTAGARLVLASREDLYPGYPLTRTLKAHNVTHVTLPPSALTVMSPEDVDRNLKMQLVGEVLPVDLANRWRTHSIYNGYGPTEGTIGATIYACRAELAGSVPIGRPIQNARVYILNERLDPVPIGETGEIYIGGVGVARGYLNQPQLTGERFIPDPFIRNPDSRIYKTGDLAKWLPDGNIIYVGRNDNQVKIRGVRIELEEIEARLRENARVREALVVVREAAMVDAHNTKTGISDKQKRLIAYVVPNALSEESQIRALSEAHIAQWTDVLNEVPDPAKTTDVRAFNPIGWRSSYTDEPISHEEMTDWLYGILSRIRALSPKRVLEIGCGTGMILLSVAPSCEHYVGIDVSSAAVERIRQHIQGNQALSDKVVVRLGEASDLSGIPLHEYDLVVLNSVVMYFPSPEYLREVLVKAITKMGQPGHIFVGDVRHLGLHTEFCQSVERHKAGEAPTGPELYARGARRAESEAELLIEPTFFHALQKSVPAISQVRILPKASAYDNEMSAYRYDVVLSVGTQPTSEQNVVWIDCQNSGLTAAGIRDAVMACEGVALGFRNIPNPLVPEALRPLDAGIPRKAPGLSCAELAGICAAHGYGLELSWYPVSTGGAYHALINPKGDAPSFDWSLIAGPLPDTVDFARYGNDPIVRRKEKVLADTLRRDLSSTLPQYMVPDAIAILKEMPRTPNGKLDRAALGALEYVRSASYAYEPPISTEESIIAEIWQELLAVRRVGRSDNFLRSGGNSLLLVQFATRLRERFGVEIRLRDLFDDPTVPGAARAIANAKSESRPAIAVHDHSGLLPLSWPQQGLWFLDHVDRAAGAAYSVPVRFRMRGTLDRSALLAALQRVEARHEALRTCFVLSDGQLYQKILPVGGGLEWTETDLTSLPSEAQEAKLEELSRNESKRRFDLSTGRLIRCHLLTLAPNSYELWINQHHIICDGWSIGLLTLEISALYASQVFGTPVDLPNLRIQYSDYSIWQKKWMRGQVLQDHVRYWKMHLTGAPPVLELPTDRPRPAAQSYSGGTVTFALPEELKSALMRLTQRHDATVFMGLFAAWAIVLSRFSAQKDLVVGTPVANRGFRELESLLGLFVNTVALRIRLEGDPTAGEVLALVREATLRGYAHQEAPFEAVVEALQPVRSLSYHPVFQVAFSFNEFHAERQLRLPGVEIECLQQTEVGARFDLSLVLTEHERGFHGALEYASELFDHATMQRMARQFRAVLDQIVEDESRRISEIPILSEAEETQILEGFNPTQLLTSDERFVHELFEEHALRCPDALAAVFQDQQLTYSELNAKANRVAHHLRTLNVGPDSRVGIFFDRGLEMIVALLATLKSGGGYIPLDPNYPAERLAEMLEDSDPSILLTHKSLFARLPVVAARIVLVDLEDEAPEVAWQPQSNLSARAVGLNPLNLAYLIYTSGSTGKPKGVIVEHRNLAASNFARLQVYGRGDRHLLLSSISFDSSIAVLYGALTHGGTVVVSNREMDVDEIRLAIQRWGVTSVLAVPSLLQLILSGGSEQQFKSITKVIAAGEVCPKSLINDVAAAAPNAILYNEYGPTEATVWATVHACTSPAGGETVPIGRPIANARIYILDERSRPVPVGVAGEIYIGGAGVARGYFNRPALTTERFVLDPFRPGAEARMYRTGDLGKWLPDGTIEFLGRNDRQMKVRGFRIEPGEVEAHLRDCPGVREAAVVAYDADQGEKRLVGYVCGVEAGQITPSALRAQLVKVLPEHMIPSAFVVLERLPLTPSGKLDRKALPPPGSAATGLGRYEAPIGPIETEIAQIWQTLLNIERIGRNDDFFEMGGHSLLVVRFLAELRAATQRPISVRWIYEASTPARLAAMIESATAEKKYRHLLALSDGGSRKPLYCLSGAEGNASSYLNIARFLDPSIPVYGVEAGHLTETQLTRNFLDDLMVSFKREIRQIQPSGPYRICGFSFGGASAFELAVSLEKEGETVELILLDAYPFTRGLWARTWIPRILMRLREGDVLGTLKRKFRRAFRNEFHRLLTGRYRDITYTSMQQTLNRKFEPFHGKVTLFKSTELQKESYRLQLDGRNGWSKYVKGSIRVILVSTDHYGLMKEPAIHSLVDHLNSILRD